MWIEVNMGVHLDLCCLFCLSLGFMMLQVTVNDLSGETIYMDCVVLVFDR